MIEVPYWWDRTTKSLAATVHYVRSDLLKSPGVEPIPIECPENARSSVSLPLAHGHFWDTFQDLTGW